jgi:hypothetical protein
MSKIILGPFFSPSYGCHHSFGEVTSLDFHIEWASATRSFNIPIFPHSPNQRPAALNLEHLLFAQKQLLFDLECSRYQVVETHLETFVPLEALLVALYRRDELNRPIFRILSELISLVHIESRVRRPITEQDLRAPMTEDAGFRLNTIIRDGTGTYADIAWQPEAQTTRFHTCICKFNFDGREVLDRGVWLPAPVIGVCTLLPRELHKLAPGCWIDFWVLILL